MSDGHELNESFERGLAEHGPEASFAWLIGVLSTQSPAQRSSSCSLIAYTGRREGIDWLEAHVASPVSGNWGVTAALLATPWPRIVRWIEAGGPQRLMALDALIACRAPAPNMSPLAQIAAPVLNDAPTRDVFEATIGAMLRAPNSPRVRSGAESVLALADEILSRTTRGVAVEDLPRLYLEPDSFSGATAVLDRQREIADGLRASIRALVSKDDER